MVFTVTIDVTAVKCFFLRKYSIVSIESECKVFDNSHLWYAVCINSVTFIHTQPLVFLKLYIY